MVYTKRLFIEITTIEQIEVDKVYLALTRNIPKSFIKIFDIKEEFTFRDVK